MSFTVVYRAGKFEGESVPESLFVRKDFERLEVIEGGVNLYRQNFPTRPLFVVPIENLVRVLAEPNGALPGRYYPGCGCVFGSHECSEFKS